MAQFTKEQLDAEIKRRGLAPIATKPKFTKAQLDAELQRRGLEIPSDDGEFVRGMKRGAENLALLTTEGLPAIAKSGANAVAEAVGIQAPFDVTQNVEAFKAGQEEIERKHAAKIPTYQDVKGFKDVIPYVAGKVGEGVPSIAASLGTSGLGMIGARAGLQMLTQKAGRKLTEKEIERYITKRMLTAGVAGSALQTVPETHMNLLTKGHDEPALAIAVGGLAAALEPIPELGLARSILGPQTAKLVSKSILRKSLESAGQTAVGEGLTEAAQEELNILAEHFVGENPDLLNRDNIDRLIESGIGGALAGGFAGGVLGPLTHRGGTITETVPKPPTAAEKPADFVIEEVPEATTYNAFNPDNSVLEPITLTPEIKDAAKAMGVQVESLNHLSTQELGEVQQTIQAIPELKMARRRVKKPRVKETPTTTPVEKIGEQTAAPISPKPIIKKTRKIKVSDPDQLARFDRLQAMDNPELLAIKKLKLQRADDNTQHLLKQGYDYKIDNPGGAWLINKQREAFTNYRPNEEGMAAKGLTGSITGLLRAKKSDKPVVLPLSMLANLPGVNNEHAKDTSAKLDGVFKDLKRDRRIKNPLLIGVNQKGEAYVMDGNNRLKAAKTLGIKELPVEIQYRNGAEKVDGPFHPDNIYFTLKNNLKLSRPTQYYGNIEDDYIAPQHIAATMHGIQLTPEAELANSQMMREMKRIAYEVAGPGVNVEFWDRLGFGEDINEDPILGAQWMTTLFVALGSRGPSSEIPLETLYHEAAHFLWVTAFSAQEKAMMLSNTGLLRHYQDQNGYLAKQDFEQFIATDTGKEEMVVNAIGKATLEYLDFKAMPRTLPNLFKRFVLRTANFINRVKNLYNGHGFRTFEDVVQSMVEGEYAHQTMSDAIYMERAVAAQRMADEQRDLFIAEKPKSYNEIVNEALEKSKSKDQTARKQMSWYGRFVRSMQDIAVDDALGAELLSVFRRRQDRMNELMQETAVAIEPYQNLEKNQRYQLGNLIDQVRNIGEKIEVKDDGIYFRRTVGGPKERISDPAIIAAYNGLHKAFTIVRLRYRQELLDKFKRAYPDLGQTFTTPDDIKTLLASVDKEANPRLHTALTNLADALTTVERIGLNEYLPRMRFGTFGIVVKDKVSGDTVDFRTIEKGEWRGLYNQFQLQQVMEELQAKYSDSTRYKVIGDKTITDFNSDTVHPFAMTYSALKNNVDPRYLNLELLSSLLENQDGLDPAELEKISNEIYNDMLTRGFKNRFKESEEIPGYSQDWDRVLHTYFTGAANFLSGVQYQEELSTLEVAVQSLPDPVKKERFEKYIEYNRSPQNDFQTMRTFNFLWTMGGNLSSALLQVFTLPTTTLGTMTQFNPNVLQNMKLIGKWFKLGLDFMSFDPKFLTSSATDVFLKHINKIQDRRDLSNTQKEFIITMLKSMQIRGATAEDQLGYQAFETRSTLGRTKEKLSHVAHLLGKPISVMEQITRFATTMANFEMFETNPAAVERAMRVLTDNEKLQATLRDKRWSKLQALALFAMDDAHAIFGKTGRTPYQTGIGGALFFPFMTYPHQMLELLARMYSKRGAEGRRGFYTTLISMALLAGLIGLPGAELLKELAEAVYKQISGIDKDFDLMIREKMYDLTGDPVYGKMLTQGMVRTFLGLDVGRRIGLAVPGQDILMTMAGIKSDPSAIFGVSGSLLNAISEAWNEYNNDGPGINVAAALMPVGAANALKAVSYTERGIATKRGVALVQPEEMTKFSIMSRALGFTSDQIATAREAQFYAMLREGKYTTAMNRYRHRAKKAAMEIIRGRRLKDASMIQNGTDKYQKILQEVQMFGKENKLPVDFRSFNQSVQRAAYRDTTSKPTLKGVKKEARSDVLRIREILGLNK